MPESLPYAKKVTITLEYEDHVDVIIIDGPCAPMFSADVYGGLAEIVANPQNPDPSTPYWRIDFQIKRVVHWTSRRMDL